MELYEDEKEGEQDWNHFIGSMVTWLPFRGSNQPVEQNFPSYMVKA